jgi:membrane-bound serine protease (ClpP class)
MCHVILLMPVLGLVVFWIWPLSVALPIYLVILAVSGTVYAAIMKAMHRPVTTGTEGLIGRHVQVIEWSGHSGHVRVQGAIWRSESDEQFQAGDTADIGAVEGLTLIIVRGFPSSGRPKIKGHSCRIF